MKTIKVAIIATIITVIIMISCAFAMPACAEELAPVYGRFAVVTETDPAEDAVICMDTQGNLWSFFGIDTWEVGDLCTITFWNNGADITDHEVLDVMFEGHMSPSKFEMIFGI